ncbi:class I SAM-dependent methyltransferase, partial [Candidatus Omnitrophota bacterium]
MAILGFKQNTEDISSLFDKIAPRNEYWRRKNYYYHSEIERFYRDIIPENKNVLEIGSADGYLLDNLKPCYGVGLDISSRMIEISSKKYPKLNFTNAAIDNYDAKAKFDYVVISNLLEYVFDLYDFFKALNKKISSNTKIII